MKYGRKIITSYITLMKQTIKGHLKNISKSNFTSYQAFGYKYVGLPLSPITDGDFSILLSLGDNWLFDYILHEYPTIKQQFH